MDDQYMKIVEEELELEKQRTLAKVAEGYESAKRRIYARLKSCWKDGSTMKLELRNRIAPMILTREEIKGEGDVPIEVALVDDVTGDVVVDEPEASANIDFFLLNVSEAGESIVPQEEGKKPILAAGNVPLQLHRGVAKINNLKIRNCATKIKPPVFKLGARVVGASVRVKEATTEAFALKDFRQKYFIKHPNPSLSDQVSRLVFISRGGKIEKRLNDNSICTVEDFLIRHLIHQQSLKNIVNTQESKWKAIVKNAQACQVSEKVYCYIVDPKQKTGVVFNILGHVLGICSGSHYSQISTLSEKHKVDAEVLLPSAYHNWKEVKVFNHLNILHQHLHDKTENSQSCPLLDPPLTELVAESFQTTNSVWENFTLADPSCPGLPNPPQTELVGKSFQATNSCGEYVVGSMNDEIDRIYDAAMQSLYAWPSSPSLF
ncbi:calmodulin-binding protein 60 B-like [Salvia splendens]|uniref:calmodulin-binding protein 60 B-like n=1 Tax=Salvia splendens TaxID=180675 RepID=UPI001C2717DE|nr:calmodulin-binding protein 60 B-like [Salvia splendens]